ncbi:hypothetical protein DXG01_010825 [Tephrocybe rancida]|nr:hypothetical protein DXG01_010825 [Tephrocybe rancida]
MSSDYVIVGAGLSGTVLASRLSEDPNVTVTVLEAGSAPFRDNNIDIPGNLFNILGNPAYDWAFFSTPQKHLGDRPVFLPRGKNIGGSSLDSLVPYFKKSETLIYDEETATKYGLKFDLEFHGTSGPLKKRIPAYINAVTVPWIETVKGLGIKHNPDPAYYEPIQSRHNLKVISGALVTKVLTSGSNPVNVTGVEYLKDGVLHVINATKEVILSAGSYKTPQILELSGFGDPEVLKKFDIDVIVDLPGDHVSATYTAKLKLGVETWTKMEDPAFAQKQVELFKTNGTGLLSGLPIVYAFLPLKDFDKDGVLAELAEKISVPDTPAFNLQKEWVRDEQVPFLEISGYDQFIPGTLQTPEPGVDYMSSSMILLHPFNHGSVHVSSIEPTSAPTIDHNYLDNKLDIKILVEGFKLTRKIYDSAPLKDLIEQEVSPGPEIQSDAELEQYIRKVVGSCFHPLGTASLLPRKDGGVVDARLKVYGTRNLRVVDASILPVELGAPLQATLYAIAEKKYRRLIRHSQAADLIKEDGQK